MATEDESSAKRPPVGPEGVAPEAFFAAYARNRAQDANWETRLPQPQVLALADRGAFGEPMLDLGCGTGENAIALAQHGMRLCAVDLVPEAIEYARERAAAALGAHHGIEFLVADALTLPAALPGRVFDTVLDSAVFHVFSDDDRARYRDSVNGVTRVGSKLYIIVFSTQETREVGPRKVDGVEIAEALAPHWQLVAAEPCRYHTNRHDGGGVAICAALMRVQ